MRALLPDGRGLLRYGRLHYGRGLRLLFRPRPRRLCLRPPRHSRPARPQDKIYTKYKLLTNAFRALDEDHSGVLDRDEATINSWLSSISNNVEDCSGPHAAAALRASPPIVEAATDAANCLAGKHLR